MPCRWYQLHFCHRILLRQLDREGRQCCRELWWFHNRSWLCQQLLTPVREGVGLKLCELVLMELVLAGNAVSMSNSEEHDSLLDSIDGTDEQNLWRDCCIECERW